MCNRNVVGNLQSINSERNADQPIGKFSSYRDGGQRQQCQESRRNAAISAKAINMFTSHLASTQFLKPRKHQVA